MHGNLNITVSSYSTVSLCKLRKMLRQQQSVNELLSLVLGKESVKKKKNTGKLLQQYQVFWNTHRKIFNTDRILKEPLKGNSPAGNSPLPQAPAALHTGKAGIATQAVFTDAVLQLSAVQLC